MATSLSGCGSGFSPPSSGFPNGYCIRQWNGTNWNLIVSSCASGFTCPQLLDLPIVLKINAEVTPFVGMCQAFACV